MKNLTKRPLLLTYLLLLLSVLFVGYRGDFPVNDDWIFVRQVESFSMGSKTLSSIVDPSFIAQGMLGLWWGNIVGHGFEQMRLLTIIFTFTLVYIVHRILKYFETEDGVHLTTLLLIAFNPLIFTSTFTFMTEVYYLVFYTASLLFYTKYFKEEKSVSLVLGSIFVGLAVLVRQVGLVPYIAFFIVMATQKKLSLKNLTVGIIPVALAFWVFAVWPKYLDSVVSTSFASLLSNMSESGDIVKRLNSLLLSLPYFAFFMLPLAFFNKITTFNKWPLWLKFVPLVLVVSLSMFLYRLDVFPVGSVFYLEALHSKSNFRAYFHIFDNVIFKELLSLLIALAFVRLGILFSQLRKLDKTSMFLLLTAVGSFASLLFGNDFYDRYLLSTFISLILFVVYYFKDSMGMHTKFQTASLVLVIVLAIIPQHEYFSQTRLRWQQARAIQEDKGYLNSIYVDGTYAKYFNAVRKEDYKGEASGVPGRELKCYVQKYTVDTDSGLFNVARWFDRTSQRLIENPEPNGSKRDRTIPNIKKRLDTLLYNQEYFSPKFNLVGKQAFVGSWCND